MKKNIVIVGYPKSGTTWVARLVAELVECPLVGAWSFDNIETAYKEGENRISNYACFKSHHVFNEIKNVSNKNIHKIIYVVRDPRDIVISSLYYFNISYPFLKKILMAPEIYKITENLINRFKRKDSKKMAMINMVLNGDKSINKWCKISWKEHLQPYLKNNVLFVSYEDMLSNPIKQCKIILNSLEIPKSRSHILKSIENQSFNSVKKRTKSDDKLFRKGATDYWRNEFNEEEKKLFTNQLKKELLKLNYQLT